jgi:spore maturation protein CgeB
MKILLVGSAAEGSLESHYLTAFGYLEGVATSIFNLDLFRTTELQRTLANRIKLRLTKRFEHQLCASALFKHLADSNYDIIIIFRGDEFNNRSLLKLKSSARKSIFLNLNPDSPYEQQHRSLQQTISAYDYYVTWCPQVFEKLKLEDSTPILLNFGFDIRTQYRKIASEFRPKNNVLFYGAWDLERERLLENLSQFDLKIYGQSWMRCKSTSLAPYISQCDLHGDNLLQQVAEAAVTINILRPQNLCSHNMRTYEVPAMGGLLLTSRSSNQNSILPENEACLMFESAQELVEKTKLAVSNPEKVMPVRRNGQIHIMEESYTKRARELLEKINLA